MLPTELKLTFSAYILTPVAFIIGVPWSDSFEVARLISLKVVFNEFVAFTEMHQLDSLSARAKQLATFSLASFANFSSLAIVQSVGPSINDKLVLTETTVMKGLLIGFLSSLFNATVAGLIHPLHIENEFTNITDTS